MNKIIAAFFLLLSFNLCAQNLSDSTPVLTTEVPDEDDGIFNPRKGHWLTTFGFEGIKYEVPFEFTGAREEFKKGTQEMWGGRLGLGREFYIGKGLMTATKVEGFYMGTLFERAINAAPEETTVEFAFTKKTGQIYGAEVVQTISFLFDMRTKNPFMDEMTYLTVEPFVEAGIGTAKAYNRRNYHFDTGANGVQENYRLRVEDDIMTQHFGLGVNVTSRQAFFLYLKASVYNLNLTKRKQEGLAQPDGQGTEDLSGTDKNVDMDPVTVYALGGGYKF